VGPLQHYCLITKSYVSRIIHTFSKSYKKSDGVRICATSQVLIMKILTFDVKILLFEIYSRQLVMNLFFFRMAKDIIFHDNL